MTTACMSQTTTGTGHFGDPFRRFFRDLLGPLPRDVLDLDAGNGSLVLMLGSLGHDAVGIEPGRDAVRRSRRIARNLGLSVDFRIGRSENIPFPDRVFDAVHVRIARLAHEIQDEVIDEAMRVLRPGGLLILSALPSDRPVREPISGVQPRLHIGSFFDRQSRSRLPHRRNAQNHLRRRLFRRVSCWSPEGQPAGRAGWLTRLRRANPEEPGFLAWGVKRG